MICFHCTEAVTEPERWQVQYDGKLQDVCCTGCQAVMQAIIDADLGDYYRFRTERAQFGVLPDELSQRLDELAVFDEPEISQRYLHPVTLGQSDKDTSVVDVNLSVEGLRCGACVWVLERSLQGMTGVSSASVNYSSSRATVTFDPHQIKLSQLLGRMAQVGYKGLPFDVHERESSLQRESRVYLQRLFVAGIATMQVMMYALPAYLSDAGDIEKQYEQLLRWASLVLTTPVLFYSAQPFLAGAWRDLKNRRPGMDVPVSVGIVAAFCASVWSTVSASGDIYFDSVAMFVFLLLGARYLEWSARRRAMRAVDDLSSAAPETAQRSADGVLESVPALRLQEGDHIFVSDGARIPVDGVIFDGRSAIDNSLITGESIPVTVTPGQSVAGGAILTGGPVTLRVSRSQSASTLSVIDRLIERGSSEKPEAVQVADRIASWFVSLLLIFATLVWLVWLALDADRALPTAIAVLVVSCPCALSMATPAALAAATGDLLKHRLLITRGHALETLATVTDIVFDKTGTLTRGQPSLIGFDVGDSISHERALRLAVALETGSTHPYAVALRRSLDKKGLTAEQADVKQALLNLGIDASDIQHEAGQGVIARLANGHFIYLGSMSLCGLQSEQIRALSKGNCKDNQAASEVYLSYRTISNGVDEGVEVLARFLLLDELRDNAITLIEQLQRAGRRVHLLSGDRAEAVNAVGRQLAIQHFMAAATPKDKQVYVSQLQDKGAIVLMIGDGINDAPVLATANVSMAAGEATALARTAADVISLQSGLDGLERLLNTAARTSKIVRQNLFWAAAYNVLAIPLAATGFVPPWAAAIGMAGSSLLVVANAHRLWSVEASTKNSTDLACRGRLWNRFSY